MQVSVLTTLSDIDNSVVRLNLEILNMLESKTIFFIFENVRTILKGLIGIINSYLMEESHNPPFQDKTCESGSLLLYEISHF